MLSTWSLLTVAGAGVLYLTICLLLQAYKTDLRDVPGPALAKFSNLWRLNLVRSGRAPQAYRELHAVYGPIVRTAPHVVDISDVQMIPIVLSINNKYVKACSDLLHWIL